MTTPADEVAARLSAVRTMLKAIGEHSADEDSRAAALAVMDEVGKLDKAIGRIQPIGFAAYSEEISGRLTPMLRLSGPHERDVKVAVMAELTLHGHKVRSLERHMDQLGWRVLPVYGEHRAG